MQILVLLCPFFSIDLFCHKSFPLQTLAIPQVLEGNNTLIAAETGNGKTLAFVAPMLQQIAQRKKAFRDNYPMNSPLGLIVVPGRELAEQIQVSIN